MAEWSFITNHGRVIAAIAMGLGVTAREIGEGRVCDQGPDWQTEFLPNTP